MTVTPSPNEAHVLFALNLMHEDKWPEWNYINDVQQTIFIDMYRLEWHPSHSTVRAHLNRLVQKGHVMKKFVIAGGHRHVRYKVIEPQKVRYHLSELKPIS